MTFTAMSRGRFSKPAIATSPDHCVNGARTCLLAAAISTRTAAHLFVSSALPAFSSSALQKVAAVPTSEPCPLLENFRLSFRHWLTSHLRCRTWLRRNFAVRNRRTETPMAAQGRERRCNRRICNDRAQCGSDAANIDTSALREGDEWVLVGDKTYISNGGIAGLLCDVCTNRRRRRRPRLVGVHRSRGKGGHYAAHRTYCTPSLARLKYDHVRVAASAILGEPGEGFRIAMETLNLFRVTVGAAALGFARRALDEALSYATARRLGNGKLADNAVTQAKLADMALALDASALLSTAPPGSRTSAGSTTAAQRQWPKLHATEAAQQVIDAAVQMTAARA